MVTQKGMKIRAAALLLSFNFFCIISGFLFVICNYS